MWAPDPSGLFGHSSQNRDSWLFTENKKYVSKLFQSPKISADHKPNSDWDRARLFYLARSAQTWQREGSIKCGICWDNAPSKLAPGTITATIHLPQHGSLLKQFKFLVKWDSLSYWRWPRSAWLVYCKVGPVFGLVSLQPDTRHTDQDSFHLRRCCL